MEKPPVIISTKDLSYICDIFNWNYTTCKLAYDISLKVNDPEIKDFISFYNQCNNQNNNMNNKVNNPEVNVSKTINMNEKNYLEVILENEKNMSNNLSIAIDEASNDLLFDKFYDIFDDVKCAARDAFNLMFKNGWYTLEKAQDNKRKEENTKLNDKLNELNTK